MRTTLPYTREHNDRSFYLKLERWWDIIIIHSLFIHGVIGNIIRVLFSVAYMTVRITKQSLNCKQSHRAVSVFSLLLP